MCLSYYCVSRAGFERLDRPGESSYLRLWDAFISRLVSRCTFVYRLQSHVKGGAIQIRVRMIGLISQNLSISEYFYPFYQSAIYSRKPLVPTRQLRRCLFSIDPRFLAGDDDCLHCHQRRRGPRPPTVVLISSPPEPVTRGTRTPPPPPRLLLCALPICLPFVSPLLLLGPLQPRYPEAAERTANNKAACCRPPIHVLSTQLSLVGARRLRSVGLSLSTLLAEHSATRCAVCRGSCTSL